MGRHTRMHVWMDVVGSGVGVGVMMGGILGGGGVVWSVRCGVILLGIARATLQHTKNTGTLQSGNQGSTCSTPLNVQHGIQYSISIINHNTQYPTMNTPLNVQHGMKCSKSILKQNTQCPTTKTVLQTHHRTQHSIYSNIYNTQYPTMYTTVSQLVSWYFEPSQPQRVTSWLKTMFNLASIYLCTQVMYTTLSVQRGKQYSTSIIKHNTQYPTMNTGLQIHHKLQHSVSDIHCSTPCKHSISNNEHRTPTKNTKFNRIQCSTANIKYRLGAALSLHVYTRKTNSSSKFFPQNHTHTDTHTHTHTHMQKHAQTKQTI